MPQFDIVNKVDHQTLDNVVNTAKKEILNRFDFRDSKSSIELDKKNLSISVITENEMRLKAIQDALITRAVKQGLDMKCFDFMEEAQASGPMLKKNIKIKEGIEKETAKKIVKSIKDLNLKVQASIMDDQLRVVGKKIDELQTVITFLKKQDVGIPLQFINMKN